MANEATLLDKDSKQSVFYTACGKIILLETTLFGKDRAGRSVYRPFPLFLLDDCQAALRLLV